MRHPANRHSPPATTNIISGPLPRETSCQDPCLEKHHSRTLPKRNIIPGPLPREGKCGTLLTAIPLLPRQTFFQDPCQEKVHFRTLATRIITSGPLPGETSFQDPCQEKHHCRTLAKRKIIAGPFSLPSRHEKHRFRGFEIPEGGHRIMMWGQESPALFESSWARHKIHLDADGRHVLLGNRNRRHHHHPWTS